MSGLTKATIAAEALTLLDTDGLGAFSLRALARRLEVTPMALYHHVANKQELVVMMVEQSLGENPPPSPSGDWQEDLWLMALWMRKAMQAHPDLAQLRHSCEVVTPAMQDIAARWFGLWHQSGLSQEAADLAAQTSVMTIWALAEGQAAGGADAGSAAAPGSAPPPLFELAVRAVVRGLHAQLGATGEEVETFALK